MNHTPKEDERLTAFVAAELARRQKDRGVALNHPESVADSSDWAFERARDGWSVAEIRGEATQLLDRADVMEGVPEMIDTVEPTFPGGSKLVTVHDPIRATATRDVNADSAETAAETLRIEGLGRSSKRGLEEMERPPAAGGLTHCSSGVVSG